MEKYYTIGEFSKLIGKSKNTLRKWDEEGKLRPHHITAGKHRVYSETQLKEALKEKIVQNDKAIESKRQIYFCFIDIFIAITSYRN